MLDEIFIQLLINWSRSINIYSCDRYGRIIGLLLWNLLKKRREQTIFSIQKHLGLDFIQAKSLAKQSFIHTGMAYFESFLVQNFDYKFMCDNVVTDDLDNINLLKNSKRPAVIVTGHLGPWEMLLALLKFYLPNKSTQVVVKFPKNKFMAKLIKRLRTERNAEIVGHRLITYKLLPNLRQGGMAAFLVDHNTLKKEAIFLPFLGEIAAVNIGPALIALRAKALIWPAFVIREGTKIRLFLEKPLDTKTLNGTLKDKIKVITQFYTQAVEKKVLSYPEQWYWLHRRWKTRPN
ncbi:KDO2-lipid IV(A) lauroyltransferase [Desulfonauticus submarinus]|uniref:KDO2-lipid IV(A) lauroyltransferase n=1 Tax=Desulfonauticus submarinus TaxID=206665 RepID=A0A1H0A2B9_9BACT|nr:lysophospholipid acyltransferase family protein [Desulfonauticus submarinus]SDN27952.1 KDO2-lipid IV(A) lauroyltransferase [Desulfonauticus submarinus]